MILKILTTDEQQYKKELKKGDQLDYEKAFIYYAATQKLISQVIPTLSDKETTKKGYIEVYDELKSSVHSDENFHGIKNYILEHSEKPNPFNFKHNGVIDSHQLKVLIDRYGNDVLLIDFRARDEFRRNHIRSTNIVCIEPIAVRQGYKDEDVELSLFASPDKERELFEKRDQFEMVIIYDIGSKGLTDEPIAKIYKILRDRSFDKPLKREPVILKGGIISWVETYGLSNFGHHHGDLSVPTRSISKPSQAAKDNNNVARSFTDYLSNPQKIDFSASSSSSMPRNYNSYSSQQHSTQHLYEPQQQQKPIRRSSSFKLPSFSSSSSPVIISPKPQQKLVMSPQQRPMSTPPKRPISSPPLPPRLREVNERTSSPKPALISHSKDSLTNGHTDLSKLYCTTGLVNMGNSCYMNCIIQCLFGTIPLLKLFIDGTWKSHVNVNSKLGTKGIMATYFAQLAQSVLLNDNAIFEPRNFKAMVGSLNSMFKNCDQQDSSEFLNFVLDGLHEDLNECGNKPREPAPTEEQEKQLEKMSIRVASTIEWERYLKSDFSAILYFFQGQFASQLKCLECGTTSTTYQSFSVLSIPIPEEYTNSRADKIPLERCFEEFTKLEVLDGENRWHCSKCKQLRKSTKKITITRLPQNLIVHLKRFRGGASFAKITTFIDYPFEMNLTKFWPQVKTPEEANQLSHLLTREQSPPFNYNLYAVANHSGSLSSGHYTAFVWKGTTKKWCYFDDTRVMKNVQKNSVVNSNGYVLFYTRSY